MDRISDNENLFVKQTRRGCFQEMMGCEAKTEFNISTQTDKNLNILYAIEESSCCIRTLCPGIRDWKMEVATNKGEDAFLEVERPMRCLNSPMKCCCLQEVIVRGKGPNAGTEYGSVIEECWYCIPQFSVKDANGLVTHRLSQPTCCGGMVVDCFAEGCCNCRVPFYIYADVNGVKSSEHDGKIVKVWRNLATEMFTDADNFEVEFPKNSSDDTKATILGGVFLLNQLFFETNSQQKQ
jgi:hypothetical protein